MLRLTTFTFVLFLLSFVAHSQNNMDNEFKKKLEKADSPDKKMSVLMEAAKYWFVSDTTRALEAVANVKAIAKKIKDPYYLGWAITQEGTIYMPYDKDKSMRLFHIADSILRKVQTPNAYEKMFILWYNYSLLLGMNKDYQFFIDISFDKLLPFAEKSGDKNILALAYIRLGTLYYNIGNYDSAEKYNKLGSEILVENNVKNTSLFIAYTGLVDTWAMKKDLKNKEKTFDTLKKAEDLLPVLKSTGNAHYIHKFYRTLAKYYQWVGQMPESYIALDSAKINAERYNQNYEVYLIQMDLVENLRAEGKHLSLEKLLNELLHDKYTISVPLNKTLILRYLSETEKSLGKYELAYSFLKEHNKLNDSIVKINMEEKVADLDKRYQTAEKEKHIALLKSSNEKQQVAIIFIMTIMLLLIVFVYYFLQLRNKRIKQKIIMVEQAKQIETSRALIDGGEQERNRIAGELHDGLGSKLTGIKMSIERLANNSKNEELKSTATHIQDTIAELRNISYYLAPPVLQEKKLHETLVVFFEKMKQLSGIKMSLNCDDLSSITNYNHKLFIYRIIQELVTNAIKHAKATEIIAQCSLYENLLLIEVEDDGVGFDPETVTKNTGLQNLENRVRYLKGKMTVYSQKDKGTNVTIEIEL